MRMLIATTALALVLGAPVLGQQAQDQQQEQPEAQQQEQQAQPEAPADAAEPPVAEIDPEVEGAPGLETGAIGETFFIRAPQEYHLLASEMPGRPVYIDSGAAGAVEPTVAEAEAAGTVDVEIREGARPAGTIVDVLLDRAGQVAGLVVELDDEMRGGAREIAVAMGLVRMTAGRDDPAETVVLLQLDPVDLENAPTFEGAAVPEGEADDGADAADPQAAGAQDAGAQDAEKPAPAPNGAAQP